MKAIGIIGEFNPFHEGHKYLIDRSVKELQADTVIAAMSGSFTQRGDFAFYDKWTRAATCLEKGIDLVCEIPVVYACNSAENFAKGGVSVLEGFGQIDHLVFGSESGDITELERIAGLLSANEEEINKKTAIYLKEGMSYPRARALVMEAMGGPDASETLKGSNNILAIEYIRQLEKMTPFTIKRKGDTYQASATRERELMEEKDPERFGAMRDRYFDILRSRIISLTSEELENIYLAGEGLGNKVKKVIRNVGSTEELIDLIKSKAYTRTRITRFLTQIILGITKEAVACSRPFARVLAFNDRGAAFLRKCISEETLSIPPVTNINKARETGPGVESALSLDIRATDMYNIISGNDMYILSDYVKKPVTG